MEIILLERIEKLGRMGEVVRVRDGYARNFLLPKHKALRATKANMERFETQRAALEAKSAERKVEASKVGETLDGKSFILVRQAAETGLLYGSVSSRDIAQAAKDAGYTVDRTQVRLEHPIKTTGITQVRIALHPELIVTVSVNVARSVEEAELQASGKTKAQMDAEADAEARADLAEQLAVDENEESFSM